MAPHLGSPRALVFVYGPALRSPLGRGQQLARHFADRLPVLYVPYRSVVELILGDARAPAWEPLAQHPNVRHVSMPLTTFLTRRSRLASRLHGSLAARRIRRELGRLKIAPREALLFAEHAMALDVAAHFPESRVVYDCADDLRNWHRNTPAMCRLYGEVEDALARRATHVVVSTPRLAGRFENSGAQLVEGLNGIDEQFLRRPDAIPQDLQALPRPWLVFTGVLSSYVDAELVSELARAGLGSVVMVGPRDPRSAIGRMGEMSNLHWLGRKPYEALPAYVHAADVALIPATEGPASDCVPSKLFMYYAAGCPIVATHSPSLEPYSRLIRLARSRPEFLAQVRAALQESDGGGPERRALAERQTWRRVSQHLLDCLGLGEEPATERIDEAVL